MKKHQTAKYKKRHKKELANRKAKRLATQQAKRTTIIVDEREPKEIVDKLKEHSDVEVVSLARRAFQDV